MYFYCICGKEGDLRVLLFRHLLQESHVVLIIVIPLASAFITQCLVYCRQRYSIEVGLQRFLVLEIACAPLVHRKQH